MVVWRWSGHPQCSHLRSNHLRSSHTGLPVVHGKYGTLSTGVPLIFRRRERKTGHQRVPTSPVSRPRSESLIPGHRATAHRRHARLRQNRVPRGIMRHRVPERQLRRQGWRAMRSRASSGHAIPASHLLARSPAIHHRNGVGLSSTFAATQGRNVRPGRNRPAGGAHRPRCPR